jgi:DDB1- and CUL4-associated factor 11
VHMTTTLDLSTTQIPISFADPYPTRHRHLADRDSRIWSCKFSADGNEIVAGGDGKIFGESFRMSLIRTAEDDRKEVYDLLANRRTVKINAHRDDVNSCCWADAASGNVLISASDDTFLKVWYIFVTTSPMTASKQVDLGIVARWVLRRSLRVC